MEYAKTLSGLLEDNVMNKILDRSEDMSPVYSQMRERWTSELFERTPTSAYDINGKYKGTNLDMVSLLNVLAERGSVINFPEYVAKGASNKSDKEWIISNKNRHGKILGLTAKKDAFSFSVRIEDQNVVDLEKSKTGKVRNFLLTDLDGNFYRGARTIEMPTYRDIVAFLDAYDVSLRDYDLKKKDRLLGNKIVRFENFVQPNLWQAFFSGDYIKTKALEKRLEDEAVYLRSSVAKIKQKLGMGEYRYSGPIDFGKTVETFPKEIETLQAEIDMPEFEGKYPAVKKTEKELEEAAKKANSISYSILPRLRFNTRAIELAFYKFGRDGEANPGWSVPEIEMGYKLPGKRTEWNRLAIDDDLSLRYKVCTRTERVRF